MMSGSAILRSRLLNDPVLALVIGTAFAAGIAALDYSNDYEVRLGVLYLPAVFLATWGAGFAAGVGIAVTSATLWFVTVFLKHPYEHAVTPYLESGLHLLGYVAFAFVVARLKDALRLADERFVSALGSLDAAAYVVDPATGSLLYANPRFGRLFGSPPSAAEVERRFGMVGEALDGERFDTESGRWYYVLARAMRWLDGRAVRLYVATDISEAKSAERLARRREEQLQRTARLIAVGEMASTLAHELNQPLGAIANYNSGCIRMLRSGSPDPAQLLELMERCSRQAQRAGDVVRRIREFVRRRPPALRAEDANAMLRDALAAAEAEHDSDAVRVRWELAQALPPVAADRMMIERVLVNLARNAFEAMRGAEQRVLTVRSRLTMAGEVECELADVGHGISPALETQLFQPFFTTRSEGTGLGLAICRSIVEYHRGELAYARNPGGGAIFRFTLPQARA